MSDSEEEKIETSLVCEAAKTGRSTCKGCKGNIPQDTVRIGVEMYRGQSACAGSELSGDFYTTKWYCVTCYPLDTVDDLESIAGYKQLFKKGREQMVELKAQRESGKRPAPAGIAKEAKKRKTEADLNPLTEKGATQPPLDQLKGLAPFKNNGPCFVDDSAHKWHCSKTVTPGDEPLVFQKHSAYGSKEPMAPFIWYDKEDGWVTDFGYVKTGEGLATLREKGPGYRNFEFNVETAAKIAHLPDSVGEVLPHPGLCHKEPRKKEKKIEDSSRWISLGTWHTGWNYYGRGPSKDKPPTYKEGEPVHFAIDEYTKAATKAIENSFKRAEKAAAAAAEAAAAAAAEADTAAAAPAEAAADE